MMNGTDGKRGPPCSLDDEIPTAEDDIGNGSGSIHKQQRPRCKKKLPREIRNIIYHNVLTRPDGTFFIGTEYSAKLCRNKAILGNDRPNARSLSPSPFTSTDPNQDAASTRNLALLRTSKAVYAEAGAILYGQKLMFANLVALQSFLAGLRPSQISLLRHVALAHNREYQRQVTFMTSVFALLAGADNLETFDPGMTRVGYLCLRPKTDMLLDDTISIAGWDVMVAHIMAAAVYCHLFTYLRRAVPVRGIDKVMQVLDVFELDFRNGLCTMSMRKQFQPRHVLDAEWTEERKAAMKKAMGEEIERLLKEDNS
ncbi:hypothetical protein INS49_007771 [Diaporthe citri]|uniref:uncharacterized protein n=1 Tax=Diaporthe citri TaxID=83186 RepID=UPI001C7F2251|nr:uncharacterized protein INS49_007771 [Diaporthe citri]KAG6362678.1 hypothetical protein INS49_007771 [Diaporthe citri]